MNPVILFNFTSVLRINEYGNDVATAALIPSVSFTQRRSGDSEVTGVGFRGHGVNA